MTSSHLEELVAQLLDGASRAGQGSTGETTLPIDAPRWERGAESRFMAEKAGYVMVRRPGYVPYVMWAKDWLKLPSAEQGRVDEAKYHAAVEFRRALPNDRSGS